MREWFAASELAGLPGVPGTDRGIRKIANRDGWQQRKRQVGKGWEYHLSALPEATRVALLREQAPAAPAASAQPRASAIDYVPEALWDHYERQPENQKARAQERLEALTLVERLRAAGLGRSRACEQAAEVHGTNRATVYRWLASVEGYHRSDWLAALVPGYRGRTAFADCDPEAWQVFKADYLRLEAPAAEACYRRLTRLAGERGWTVPSCKSLKRRLRNELPAWSITLAREGVEALRRELPAQERDHSVFHALEAVNADGHKFDVFVRWPDGTVARPLMVAWQDIYSGKLLSWRVDRTENSDGYRLSFGDMVEDYGVPSLAYLDNGRGIAAKHLTGGAPNRYRFKVREEDPVGILVQLGVEPHWATPYRGQSKPIERAFRDFCEDIAKHPAFAGAYTGNRPDAQPENYGSSAVPLETFLQVLEREIRAHNARQGRRSKVCAGRSFDAVFAESYERAPIRRATEAQRRLWLLAAESIKSHRHTGGVRLLGTTYWCEALAQHKGEKLTVRFDPDHLDAGVHVYTADGRYIAEAPVWGATAFNDTRAARERARLEGRQKKHARTALELERQLSAADVARELADMEPEPEATPPQSKVVQGIFTERLAAGHDVAAETEAERDAPEPTPAERYNFDDYMERAARAWRQQNF